MFETVRSQYSGHFLYGITDVHDSTCRVVDVYVPVRSFYQTRLSDIHLDRPTPEIIGMRIRRMEKRRMRVRG